jgi:hypothetical protein
MKIFNNSDASEIYDNIFNTKKKVIGKDIIDTVSKLQQLNE